MASFSLLRTLLTPSDFPRGLAGFRSRSAPELQPSGVAALDSVLGGGFPRGSLVEVCGSLSSGRTSLGLALLAQATNHGEACAFLDVSDSLDPVSLAAAGVVVSRLLWIRCGEEAGDSPLPPPQPSNSNFAPSCDPKKNALEISKQAGAKQTHGFYWQHPRTQIHGVETFIPQLMLKKESIKESSRSERSAAFPENEHPSPLIAKCSGEQVEADRQLPRRGENIRRHSLPPRTPDVSPPPLPVHGRARKPWKRLEQALKAADLLLHGGGWGVVVFDLGNISWVDARKIPLSTWFRFQRTIENTPAILLLLGEESCAKSCASVVLRCRRLRESWSSAACNKRPGPATLQGFEIQGEIVRSRTHFQACNFASWETHTIWKDNF